MWQVKIPRSRGEKNRECQSPRVLTTSLLLLGQAAHPGPVGSREELWLPGVGPDWTDPGSGPRPWRPPQILADVSPSAVGAPDTGIGLGVTEG